MAGIFSTWLIPGIVTVSGGTALAVILTGASMSSDLGSWATAALSAPEHSWTHVEIEGREAILSGIATSQPMIDAAITRLAEVHGLQGIQSAVTLAEFVSPFPFTASLSQGRIILTGGFPDEASHTAIVATAENAVDQLRLLSGGPDSALFRAGASYGIRSLGELDQGSARLADLSLTIEGRAKSPEAFAAIEKLRSSVPPGIRLAALTVTPALASPFTWTAEFDGNSVSIGGHTERPDLTAKLRAAAAGVAVKTELTLASGSPIGFDANTLILLKALLQLERGHASISDQRIELTGAPATAEIGLAVTAAVTGIGGTAKLEPPRIANFAFTATKADDGVSYRGFVPDDATRDRLAAADGANVSSLQLGRGAPSGFAEALDFGLAALAHVSEGEFAINDTSLTLTGRANALVDLAEIDALTASDIPVGMRLRLINIRPPLADPFTFSATKAAGGIALAGYVPSDDVRQTLLEEIDVLANDKAAIADGAPDNFGASARSGLTVLSLLDTGTLAYDGSNWSIEGDVDTPQKGFAADAAYSIAGLRTAGWTYDIHVPAPPALPIVDPYVWGAQKAIDGHFTFTGFTPDEDFKDYFVAKAGSDVTDTSLLGTGEPDKFTSNAMAGFDALQKLEDGSLAVTGNSWTLTGRAASASVRAEIQDALSRSVDTAAWRITVQSPDSTAPIVTPYLWAAEKAEDGSTRLSGYVPSEALKTFVAQRAGTVSRDTTAIASGEPSGFSDDVLAGLEALAGLTSGRASFDGSQWVLSGKAASGAAGTTANDALLGGSRDGVHWQHQITVPEGESAAEAPAASSSEPPPEAPTTASESAEPPAATEAPNAASAPAPDATTAPSAPAAEADLAIPASLAFEAVRPKGAAVALSGRVLADATRAYFGVIAGSVPTERVSIDPTLPPDFIANATVAVEAVTKLVEGRGGFDGKRWWLTGKALDEATRLAVLESVRKLPTNLDWSVKIDLYPAIELCRETVSALAARNAIIFKSGSATLTDDSAPAIDELATDLRICPDAIVHVEGHTDADGPEDVNLALSVSRAESVVEALIARGIDIERLYAEGYGETVPIASNDTRNGKQANRRIAFTITESD